MKNIKPPECMGCPLYEVGQGFAPPSGPVDSDLCFWGEALGADEVRTGTPFTGMAGNWLNRHLSRLGVQRERVRVANVISCRPPNNKLSGMPWEYAAISHCAVHREAVLQEKHRVHVALGGIPAKMLLGYPKGFTVEEFHGSPFVVDGRTVIPTYHPAFITKGNFKYTNVWLFDVTKAIEISKDGIPKDNPSLVIDPSVEWFRQWASVIDDDTWLVADIETPMSRSERPTPDDPSYQIVRISFSYNPDEGVTIPWAEPYITVVKEIFLKAKYTWWWNWRYDVPRLEHAGVKFAGKIIEGMDAWGALQSDLASSDDDGGNRKRSTKGTRRLGFVAPFYSNYGPWKHLSDTNLPLYSALDAVQTMRCVVGIARDLQSKKLWEPFWRHRVLLDEQVLRPAERKGILVDKEELKKLRSRMEAARERLVRELQELAQIESLDIKTRVKDPTGYTEEEIEQQVNVCLTCGATDVVKKHRCKDKKLTPQVEIRSVVVKRFVKRTPFNPNSIHQILQYMEEHGDTPGRGKKTKGKSTNATTLEKLANKTDSMFYKKLLEYRAVEKVLSTYVLGAEQRLKEDGRLHPEFTHKPSMWRTSCVNPNLQNVDSREEDEDDPRPEAGFKRAIVAGEGKLLVEADFSGIEAVLSGYFMNDPIYMRLAKLGVHSYLTSHRIGKPANLLLPDDELGKYLATMKSRKEYKPCKKTVHLSNYGGSEYVMHASEPQVFPTVAAAKELQQLYFRICPSLPRWWTELRTKAHKQNYLGGADHPFGYIHWFFNVWTWNQLKKKMDHGQDAKRVIAFYPQSTAFGVLAEVCLEITTPESEFYVGDMDEGDTPIRAIIHDSILGEVPEAVVDEYCRRVYGAMTSPIPQLQGLVIGCEIKVGKNWGEMKKWDFAKAA